MAIMNIIIHNVSKLGDVFVDSVKIISYTFQINPQNQHLEVLAHEPIE